MNNKKGISAIVATVLIILITVAAVTIIWAAIIPMISNQLESGTICLDAVSQVQLPDDGYSCKKYDATTGNYTINLQVSHGSKSFQLSGLQVLVSEQGASTQQTVTSNLPGINEDKMISVQYRNSTTAGPDGVSIAPIVKVGNTQETCEISATKTLDLICA
jgi:flagellin-like protein